MAGSMRELGKGRMARHRNNEKESEKTTQIKNDKVVCNAFPHDLEGRRS